MGITLHQCSNSCRPLSREASFKVGLSPRGHLFSQYDELYIQQCTYLDVRDYTELNIVIDVCWFGILPVLLGMLSQIHNSGQ